MDKILAGTGIAHGTGYTYENTVTPEYVLSTIDENNTDTYFLMCTVHDPKHWKHVDTYLDEKEWRIQISLTLKSSEIDELWADFCDAMFMVKEKLLGARVYTELYSREFVCILTYRLPVKK